MTKERGESGEGGCMTKERGRGGEGNMTYIYFLKKNTRGYFLFRLPVHDTKQLASWSVTRLHPLFTGLAGQFLRLHVTEAFGYTSPFLAEIA